MTINPQNFEFKTKLRHTGIDQKMATIKMVKNDQNFRFPTQSPILWQKLDQKMAKEM